MAEYWPDLAKTGYAPRHIGLWEWIDGLRRGVKPQARIECWARGSGKSTTAELACARLATTMQRRFALVLSRTQAQADMHVRDIGTAMQVCGLAPAINRQGRVKAWRRDQLMTSTGFSVAAYGLDVATRGVKIEQFRPDFLIIDDIDAQGDSPEIIKGMIESLTLSVLPSGSPDLAVLFIQNKINGNGVMAQLIDGRAEYLSNRCDPTVSPAVEGLEVAPTILPNGKPGFRIVSGVATWAGQNLELCESQINEWTLDAFLREAQHEVSDLPSDPVFDIAYLSSILPKLPPPIKSFVTGENGLCGNLDVWEDPEEGVEYVIGGDVSKGIVRNGTDECDAEVLRKDSGAQVASYWGKPDAKNYAQDLLNLSYTYNDAEIAPESNDIGHVVVAYLEDWGAPLWYSGTGKGALTPDQDNRGGFNTGEGSKALTDSELRSALVECKHGKPPLIIRSRRCVEQMLHYIHLPKGGRGNSPGYHDDAVRALGIAYYLVKFYRPEEGVDDYEPVAAGQRYQPEYAGRRGRI